MTDRQIITIALCAFVAVGSVVIGFAAQPAEYPTITAAGRGGTSEHGRNHETSTTVPPAERDAISQSTPAVTSEGRKIPPAIRSRRPPLAAATTRTSSAPCWRRPVEVRPRHSRLPRRRLLLRQPPPSHRAPPHHLRPHPPPPGHQAPPHHLRPHPPPPSHQAPPHHLRPHPPPPSHQAPPHHLRPHPPPPSHQAPPHHPPPPGHRSSPCPCYRRSSSRTVC